MLGVRLGLLCPVTVQIPGYMQECEPEGQGKPSGRPGRTHVMGTEFFSFSFIRPQACQLISLFKILIIYLLLAASGLCCGARASVQLRHAGCLVEVRGLSHPPARGLLVPQPRVEPCLGRLGLNH